MSSAIVTTILVTVMLLIIGSFVFSAWFARREHMRELAQDPPNDLGTTTGRMMVVVQLLDGSVVGIENQLPAEVTNKLPAAVPSAHLPHSWYNRQRTLVSLGLLTMLVIGLLVESGVAGDAFHTLTQGLNLSGSQSSVLDLQTAFQPIPFSASARIIRVDSASRDQYYTDYQYQVWSYSSCSGISLEEVMDAYGRQYIAADVLQIEQNMGVWDTYDGLLGGEPAMAKVATYFGFQVSPNPPRTLQALILVANKGFPVIVGIPGHIMVIKGGDANYVYVVDSSPANREVMTHDQFMNVWDGFSVLITPPQPA
jgi:hypothetical protein